MGVASTWQVSIVLKCLEKVIFCERNLVVFWNTLLEVGISFAALAPTMTSCSSPEPRSSCDPNPPTYCSNRVPRQTKSCFILFINREEGGVAGAGARMGRVVASKRDPYYVWHTQISTIQECMQTANLRQNVNSWYLATNANKFWNQSWKKWNKKSDP